ncbi:MAG: adenylate kinase [Anaerolineaceae bacterium]|nr:MAG: adenylate kinase [Anaerolineaceae bacterium]
MPAFIVLLGPPGVGKGTQAKIIAAATGLPHVSSGDLFRENIKNETELGRLAQSYISKGELVPDDVTIGMIRDRISRPDCKSGALLDGFPRTTVQAAALENLLAEFGGKVDTVPYISASESTLVERLGGRWNCKAQGHVFHEKHNPPKQAGVCDFDGSELYQRDDDKAETVTRRIQVYFAQTAPLVAYYRERGRLSEIDGAQPIEKVTADLLAALKM